MTRSALIWNANPVTYAHSQTGTRTHQGRCLQGQNSIQYVARGHLNMLDEGFRLKRIFSSIHRKINTEMLMRISLKVKDVNLVTVFGTTCPKTLLCTLNAYATAFIPRQSLYQYPIRHGMTWFIQQLWRHAIHCCWMCQKHKENDSKHHHSIILLFTVWTISGL